MPTPAASAAPSRGLERSLRSAVLGLSAVLLALVGHRIGGGGWVPAVVWVPVAGACAGAAWGLTGRRVRTAPVVAVVVISQVVVHLMACYLHGHAMVPSLPMLLVHGVMALLGGVLVARADALWWALLGPLSGLGSTRLPLALGAAPVLVSTDRLPGPTVLLAHSVARRGPPLT